MQMLQNIALVGCGGWGKNLARNLNELGALKIIIDPADHGKDLAAKLGVSYSADLAVAFQDDAISGVVIATPAATHVSVAQSCIAAQKHVYIEKPIALNIEDAQNLASYARERKRVLMVGHLLQYHPVYRKLYKLVQEGRLGQIKHITSSRLNFGLLRHEEHVMWSFAPHDISMVLGLAGKTPSGVLGVSNAFLQDAIPDITAVHLRFEDGLRCDVSSSWLHPEKIQKLIVIGDKAMAVFSDTAKWEEKLAIQDFHIEWNGNRPKLVKSETQFVEVSRGEPLKMEMEHFLHCINTGSSPLTDSKEAIGVLTVLKAAQHSIENGGIWVND